MTSNTLVVEVRPGQVVTYRGEESNAAYYILKGSVGAGYIRDDEYVILNYLKEGDFFGELAALTGMKRTANIITEAECEFLILPAGVLQRLARNYPGLNVMRYTVIGERLSQTDLPRGMRLDQQLLRELRSSQPDMEEVPIQPPVGI